MVGLNVLFWFFVFLFGVIGLMRGWAKELLVFASAILGLFIIEMLETFVSFVKTNLAVSPGPGLFWMRLIIFVVLAFFGYQSPNIPKLASSGRFARERLQDALLGFFLGAVNGFFLFGSIWFFLQDAGYPYPGVVSDPAGTQFAEAADTLFKLLPPVWLGSPAIYFAVAVVFVFILVVFL
jgi:hypothetical protein